MGSGDLNMKKSWHPLLITNQERVWKVEKAKAEEAKKTKQLMKERDEERQLADLQRMQEEQTGKKKVDKLDWMYAAPASGGGIKGDELEDYLLGKRRVDKILQGDEEKQVAAAQANLIAVQNANSARDTASKIREDPLLAIKQQEQAAYQALLSNPLRLKQLQEKAGLKADKKDEKKKEKEEKRRRKEERRERRARGEKGGGGRSESPELELGAGGIGEALDRRERERGGHDGRRDRSRSPARRYDDRRDRDRSPPRRRDDYDDRRRDSRDHHHSSSNHASSSSSRYPSSSHRDRSPPRSYNQSRHDDRPSSSSHNGAGPSSSSSYNRPPPPPQQYQSRPTAADYNNRYGGASGSGAAAEAGPGPSAQAAKLEADRKARLEAMMGNASEMTESRTARLTEIRAAERQAAEAELLHREKQQKSGVKADVVKGMEQEAFFGNSQSLAGRLREGGRKVVGFD